MSDIGAASAPHRADVAVLTSDICGERTPLARGGEWPVQTLVAAG